MCEPTCGLLPLVSSSCAPLTRSTSSITNLVRPYYLPSDWEIQSSFAKILMLLATRKLHWSLISCLSFIYETLVLWNFNSRSSLLALKFRLNGSNRRRREMLKLLRTNLSDDILTTQDLALISVTLAKNSAWLKLRVWKLSINPIWKIPASCHYVLFFFYPYPFSIQVLVFRQTLILPEETWREHLWILS